MTQPVDFDDVLETVGGFGRYQLLIYILICFPASLPSAWTAFNQVFVAAVPPHWCKAAHRPDGESGSCFQFVNDTSDETTACQEGWGFDNTTYTNTIVSQFLLVCDRKHLVILCTTMFYIGSFIGNILFGYIADRCGRRVSFFLILAVQVVSGTGNAFAPNITTFIALRSIVGLAFPALFQIPFIISMEIMGPDYRIFAGMIICVFFGVAMCILGAVGALLRDWTSIVFVSNTPFVLLFVYILFLPESPRWLVSVNRIEDAVKTLMAIGRANKKPQDEATLRALCREAYENSEEEKQRLSRANLFDLFRTPNLRKKTFIVTFIWFVNAVVYNGLTLNVSNLPVNDYLSFAINGAVELPAYFIAWPLLAYAGRRWSLCLFMLLGGLACISTMFIPEQSIWVICGLAFVGKFGIAASFSIIYIFAGELYPTVVRAVGMGMSSMVAGSGIILAPSLVSLGEHVRILPLLVMGCLTMSAGVASTFLPETLGAHLPQSVSEAEEFGKQQPFWHWPSAEDRRRAKELSTKRAARQQFAVAVNHAEATPLTDSVQQQTTEDKRNEMTPHTTPLVELDESKEVRI